MPGASSCVFHHCNLKAPLDQLPHMGLHAEVGRHPRQDDLADVALTAILTQLTIAARRFNPLGSWSFKCGDTSRVKPIWSGFLKQCFGLNMGQITITFPSYDNPLVTRVTGVPNGRSIPGCVRSSIAAETPSGQNESPDAVELLG